LKIKGLTRSRGVILIVIILYSPKGIWDLTRSLSCFDDDLRDELTHAHAFGDSKNFGGLQVLEQISLTIPQRGIYGLIGPNGAGKTTLFNFISGLLQPSAGTIHLADHRLDGMAPFRITRLGVAWTFQNIRLFKDMTLLENVLVPIADDSQYRAISVLLPLARFRGAEKLAHTQALGLLAKWDWRTKRIFSPARFPTVSNGASSWHELSRPGRRYFCSMSLPPE
jgi:hypothetical protein